MFENFDEEQKNLKERMQKLFHDFYHAGLHGPDTGMTGHTDTQAAHSRRAAAGGRHEHQD